MPELRGSLGCKKPAIHVVNIVLIQDIIRFDDEPGERLNLVVHEPEIGIRAAIGISVPVDIRSRLTEISLRTSKPTDMGVDDGIPILQHHAIVGISGIRPVKMAE